MRFRSQSGVVLIQVGLVLVVLLGVSAFVIDHGVLMLARAQAQNAADAGALAGAVALAFDSERNTAANKTAIEDITQTAALRNLVWGKAPVVAPLVPSPSERRCPVPAAPLRGGQSLSCVIVSVSSPVPTFFGRLINVPSHGVRAQAVGTSVAANTTACVWPLAIPDRWFDQTGEGGASQFDPPGDTYTAPTATNEGTGFSLNATTLAANQMYPITLSTRANDDFTRPLTREQFVSVKVPGGDFRGNLATCNRIPVSIGDVLPLDAGGSLPGAVAEAQRRISMDPGARMVNGKPSRGSCADCAMSPRLVSLPLFDVNRYEATRGNPGGPTIEIVNFVGFFIEDSGGVIKGWLATFPGEFDSHKPAVRHYSAFLRAGVLYR